MLFGIIGFPLSHSFSRAYFTKKFTDLGIDAQYFTFPITHIELYPELLDTYPKISGLNVTIPYKQSIIPYLDFIDPEAAEIGAVNCIAVKDSISKGYNTDILGFEVSLLPLLPLEQNIQSLILGTGGASNAVAYVLQKRGITYKKVSRTKNGNCITYNELTAEMIASHKLIINATPVGMYPDVQHCPQLPYEYINDQHIMYDLIYNPVETLFLKKGAEMGATIKNGYEMLLLQAEASWKIWMSNNH